MDTAKGLTSMQNFADIRMATAKGHPLHDDIRMETARGATTLKQGGLQVWERELLESSEVKRKATVAQLCKSKQRHMIELPYLGSRFLRFFRFLLPDIGLHSSAQRSALEV